MAGRKLQPEKDPGSDLRLRRVPESAERGYINGHIRISISNAKPGPLWALLDQQAGGLDAHARLREYLSTAFRAIALCGRAGQPKAASAGADSSMPGEFLVAAIRAHQGDAKTPSLASLPEALTTGERAVKLFVAALGTSQYVLDLIRQEADKDPTNPLQSTNYDAACCSPSQRVSKLTWISLSAQWM
ncbi:hypothetical protein NFJ02_05g119430 [Pycnococcus provasolii]